MRGLDLDLNLDLNLDLDMAAGFGGAASNRVARFNSYDYVKFVDIKQPLASARLPSYNRLNWDPQMLSYDYIGEFLAQRNWFAQLVRAAGTPPNKLRRRKLEEELRNLVVLAESRHERFSEILAQDSGMGALQYFFGVLKADSRASFNTLLLVHVARRIGEMVTMMLKSHFMSPRPTAICTVLVPMIDPPATPSFPGGHSLQSDMIARALLYAFPEMPQREVLSGMAKRIGVNREIAGIHFARDTEAGLDVARKCMELVVRGRKFNELVRLARAEFPTYASARP